MLKQEIPQLTRSAVELFGALISGLSEVGIELLKSIPDLVVSFGEAISGAFTGVLRGIEEGLTGIESDATRAERAIDAIDTAHEERMTQLSEEKTAIEENQKSWDDFIDSQKASTDEELFKVGRYDDLLDELDTLIGKNGEVKDSDKTRVDFIKTELSEGLGIEKEKIDDLIKGNGDLREEISKVIEQKKAQIILAQKEAAYEEALKRQPELYDQLAESQRKLAQTSEEMKKADEDKVYYAEQAQKAHEEGNVALEEWYRSLEKTSIEAANAKAEEVEKLKENEKEIQDQLDETEFALQDYQKAYEQVQQGNYSAVKNYSYKTQKQFTETGDAQKAELEKQLTEEKNHRTTLRNLLITTGDEMYNDQMQASSRRIAQLEKQLNEYNSKTDSSTKEGQKQIKEDLDTGGNEAREAWKKSMDSMKGDTEETWQSMTEAGKNAIWGFVNGVKDAEANGELNGWMGNVASGMAEQLRKNLKIHSPSKITEEIGKYFVEGLNVGVKKATSSAARQVISLGKEVTEQAETMIGRNGDISETVTKQLKVGVETDGLVAKLRTGIADGKAMVAQALTAKVIHSVDVNTEEINRKMILHGDVISHISIDGREFAVVSAPFVSEELQWNGGRA